MEPPDRRLFLSPNPPPVLTDGSVWFFRKRQFQVECREYNGCGREDPQRRERHRLAQPKIIGPEAGDPLFSLACQIRANFEELLGGGETKRSCMMLAIRPTAIRHGSRLLPPLRGCRIVAANKSTARPLITVTTPGSFVLGIGRRQFSRASRTRPDQSVSNFRLLARGVYYLRIPFLVLSG